MCNRFLVVTFLILTSLHTGCASPTPEEMTPAPTHSIVLATASATLRPTSAPSEAPRQPSPQPTLAPVEGLTSTQVNVRAEPSTSSRVLGVIPANARVEITGKDPGENWWQINYPEGVDGKGWVTAQYITAATRPEVPTIGGPETDPNQGSVAVVQQQLNVRSGPGTDFNSLGTLNPQDVVRLTGKDSNGTWLQIDYPLGPEGKGWVSSAFVQAQGTENLPIIAESGLVVGTATPTSIPATPTATVLPAWEDQDSATHPIASVIFELTGTQTFIYNGDLSSPQGDSEDWVAFKPNDEFIFVSLECRGSHSIRLTVLENTSPPDTSMGCGDIMKRVIVKPASDYLIHVQALSSAGELQYTKYVLTVEVRP